MRGSLASPDYWYSRAEEARIIAESMSDDVARDLMLSVADTYRRLAERAEMGANHESKEKG
jgi:hypothetical protein